MLTTENFDQMSWHDNVVHAFRILDGGESAAGQLAFDIDYITEWLHGPNQSFQFKIAPSDFIFNEVSDLVISIDFSAASAAVQPMAIHEIEREVISYPNGYSSYLWKVNMNWPPNGCISFQASGFTQVPRTEPVTSGGQNLTPMERRQ